MTTYRPGDIVNGHILGQDYKWHPLGQPEADPTVMAVPAVVTPKGGMYSVQGTSPATWWGELPRSWQCKSCDQTFSTKRARRQHEKADH